MITLLQVGFLEYVNGWGGGAIRPPVRSRELTGRFRRDEPHSIPLIVNFQNHYKKMKSRKFGVLEAQLSENFAIFAQLLKLL